MFKKLLMTALLCSMLFLGSNINVQAAIININVIDLAGAPHVMSVDTTQTIQALKVQIQTAHGIAPNQQKLVFGNTKLQENQTLGYYGILGGNTVNLLSLNTAGDFPNLNGYTGSSTTGVITLTDNITANTHITTQNSPNLEINGNGYTLDGNKALIGDTHGQFKGFNLTSGQLLTLRDLTMKNFYGSTGTAFGAIFNNGGTLSIYDSIFSNNSGTTYGAILNSGAANIYSSEFTSNSSGNFGGAIYHGSGLLNIYDSTFTSNNAAGGGAISSNGTANIYNSTFTKNTTGSANTHGGAIYNQGTLNVHYSTFGSAAIADANTTTYGGAIANYTGTANIYNSTFKNNIASLGGTGQGGAIYHDSGTLNLYDSTFSNNTALNNGGAIYSNGTSTIHNSTFSNNTATYNNGGAIYNTGTATIYNSTFTNNTANNDYGGNVGANGGAIFNSAATLNLIADTGNVKFTGNRDFKGSNAITVVNGGKVNLNAGYGQVILNDGIKSDGVSSDNILNINQTGTGDAGNKLTASAPTSGSIVLNNALTGFNTNTFSGESVNLYNTGALKLGSYTDPQTHATSYGSIGTSLKPINLFTMHDNAILDLANGRTNDAVYIKNFTSTETPRIWSDIDLNHPVDGLADKLNISGTVAGAGTLQYKTFRMLNEGYIDNIPYLGHLTDTLTKTVTVLEGTNKPAIAVAPTYTTNYSYTITNNGDGTLTFTRGNPAAGAAQGIRDALTAGGERSFSLTNSYTASANLPQLTTGELTIFGNGNTNSSNYISGDSSNPSLLNVASGATLNIVDAVVSNPALSTARGVTNSGTTNIYNSRLSGNNVAIYNTGTANIYNSTISNNTGSVSGLNNQSKANIFDSTFTGNTGIALGNYDTANINHSTFTSNSGNGAIYNRVAIGTLANLTVDSSTFGGPLVSDGNSAAYAGGAIRNSAFGFGTTANSTISNSTFTHNVATNLGGAIYNESNGGTAKITISDSTFTSNSAANGGAIYNAAGGTATTNITNSSFLSNTATTKGGAIYNDGGIVGLIANGDNVTFTGNKAASVSNAIYLENGSTLNLNAVNGNAITFNDRITSGSNSNTININGRNDAGQTDKATIVANAPTNGTVVLNEDMTGFGNNAGATGNTVNLYNGTIKLGADAKFLEKVDFNMYQGTTLDMQNTKIDNIKLDTLNLKNAGNSYVKIDADLAHGTADNFMGTTVGTIDTDAKLNIKKINVLSDTAPATTSIQMADNAALQGAITLDNTQKSVMGPIYRYDVDYNKSNGLLTFQGGGNSYSGYNPKTFSSGVAAQTSGYLGAIATYNDVLSRVDQPLLDNAMLQSQLGYDPKLLNKSASAAGNIEFSPLMEASKKATAWFRPFSTFENIPLNNGPKVSNVAYGSIFGSDCGLKQLKRGYQYVMTGYGGYTGSRQAYDGINLSQNGGFAGIMGTLYKGDFFTALTTSAGASSISSNNSPDFGMFNAGVASRTGYNHRMMDNKLILQPNYLMSYTFVNTQDYTNNQGVKISTDPLNAMQIAPGVRLIANLHNGWQPYLATNMVFNLLDKTNVTANNVTLPQVSVDPYVEYGAGVQKKRGKRFTGFLQSMLRSGGRNGVSLFAGFKWTI